MSEQINRFSVVIPMFNAATTIVACVESVLAQSFPAFEVFVVNDGSTDESEKVILERFNGRVNYIVLPRNSGPSTARNAGMDAATGTHIALLDADDIWHPEKLKMVNMALLQHPDADLIYHDFSLSKFDVQSDRTVQLQRLSFASLLSGNKIATPCTILKSATALRFEPSMHHTEDYDLFLRTAYSRKIYHLPIALTTLGRPVLSTGGQSSNRWKMRKGEMRTYARLIQLNFLFVPLIPFLFCWSLLKHFRKIID